MVKEEEKHLLDRKRLLDQVEGLIEKQDFEELRQLLADARSSDVAEVVEVIDEVARQILFDLLNPKDAGEVIEKIDEATRSEVMENLSSDKLSNIVSTLPPDEAADVVGELNKEQSEEVLEHISEPESEQLEKLLTYEEDTAGGIMTPVMVTVNLGDTISQAVDKIRRSDPDEDFFYAFVVDDQGRYRGAVGIRSLLQCPPDTPVAKVLVNDLPTVEVHADQEEVANTFRKNDLMVMPVLDESGLLVGRITVDDVIDVMDEEAEEDALVMAGTHPDELDSKRLFRAAGVRLPWLITCLVGSMISAITIYFFGSFFPPEQILSVASFVPAIAAMGGNSGLQTSTIVVRGLATGDLAALKISQVFLRESRVALIVAVACGLIAGMLSRVVLQIRLNGDEHILQSVAVVPWGVGVAMFCGIMLATSLGLILPFMFRRLQIDPAISSGPLITTTNDILSNAIYFTVALLLFRIFGN